MPPLQHLRSLRRLLPPSSYPVTTGRRVIHFSSAADDPGGATEAAGSLSCPLKSRAILRFRGPDTVKFLQGLLTNDVRVFSAAASGTSVGGGGTAAASSCLPTPNMPLHQPAPVYSAMLTPQGRFLYDLFLYSPPRATDKFDRTGSGPVDDGPDSAVPTLFADVDGSLVDEVLSCFRKYKLRSKVEIDNVTQDLNCWQRFGSHLTNSAIEEPEAASVGWGAGVDPAGVSSAQGDNSGWRWFRDPRLKSLGFRGIFPSDVMPPLVESDKETDEGYYLLWRVQKGVAEGSTEMPKGEAIPLEYNLAGLNAISFDKGCYVGQELVARTHHRGVIRKRLLPFKLISRRDAAAEMQKVAPGSDIVDSTSDKKVGTVTVAAGHHGIGLLRLEEAFRSASLAVKGQEGVRVEVFRPDWWPSDWLPDLEQQKSAA